MNRHVHTGKVQNNLTPGNKESLGVEARISRLESIVGQMGEAVLATTETIDRLAERVDALVTQVQHQGHHVQQQGYQLFALSDAVQTLAETQNETLAQLGQLTETLRRIADSLEAPAHSRTRGHGDTGTRGQRSEGDC